MSKRVASRTASPSSAPADHPAEQRQRERARLRRQLAKGRSLAQQHRSQEAIDAYREARRTAEALADGIQDGIQGVGALSELALSDLSRIDRLIGEEARRLGDTGTALDAFRACHQLLSDLVVRHPDDTERQHDLVRVRAALRDVLRETQDERLALAAARMAATAAQTLAEQHPHDPAWATEAINQRLALARILRKATPDDAFPAYFDVLRMARRLGAAGPLDGLAWDLVKRAHLDLAELQQNAGLPADALSTMASFRGHAVARLSAAPELGGRALDCALERYLSGLILAASDDDERALLAFEAGLGFIEGLDGADYLTAHAQQHRGRMFAHAEKAAQRLGDETRREALRQALLDRLERLALDDPQDAKLQHAIVSHSYDLARTLIDKQALELAADALTFAEEVLEAQAARLDDQIYIRRWRAFLKLELGRAWQGSGDIEGAREAFAGSLVINQRLSAEDPTDIRAQCDGAYAEWQLALLTREGRMDRLRRARGVLKFLERSGRLPPYAKPWIGRVEQDVAQQPRI